MRLKVVREWIDAAARYDEFQFQIGAIKSHVDVYNVRNPAAEFQFQIGAIKSQFTFHIKSGLKRFQFQIGAIKSRIIVLLLSLSIVSIPNWCD